MLYSLIILIGFTFITQNSFCAEAFILEVDGINLSENGKISLQNHYLNISHDINLICGDEQTPLNCDYYSDEENTQVGSYLNSKKRFHGDTTGNGSIVYDGVRIIYLITEKLSDNIEKINEKFFHNLYKNLGYRIFSLTWHTNRFYFLPFEETSSKTPGIYRFRENFNFTPNFIIDYIMNISTGQDDDRGILDIFEYAKKEKYIPVEIDKYDNHIKGMFDHTIVYLQSNYYFTANELGLSLSLKKYSKRIYFDHEFKEVKNAGCAVFNCESDTRCIAYQFDTRIESCLDGTDNSSFFVYLNSTLMENLKNSYIFNPSEYFGIKYLNQKNLIFPIFNRELEIVQTAYYVFLKPHGDPKNNLFEVELHHYADDKQKGDLIPVEIETKSENDIFLHKLFKTDDPNFDGAITPNNHFPIAGFDGKDFFTAPTNNDTYSGNDEKNNTYSGNDEKNNTDSGNDIENDIHSGNDGENKNETKKGTENDVQSEIDDKNNSDKPSESKKNKTPLIVGLTVGFIALAAASVGGLIYHLKFQKKSCSRIKSKHVSPIPEKAPKNGNDYQLNEQDGQHYEDGLQNWINGQGNQQREEGAYL